MFDKFKDLKKMKDLQKSLAGQKEEVEKEGVRIVVNGKMEIEEVFLNPGLSKERQEKLVKECFNEAVKKIQMIAVKQMAGMGGL